MVRIVILRLMESYFRHRWLYLLPIVIAAVAGSIFTATATPKYVAKGQLYVEKESLLASLTSTSSGGSWWVSPAQTTTSEIQELLGTRAFVRSAIQKTDLERGMSAGPDTVDDIFTFFREAISIQPAGDKLIYISATSDDPKLAHQMVIATMNAYVQWKINTDYQESVAARTFFEGLITPYTEQVDAARADLVNYLDQYPAPVRGERPPQEELEISRLTDVVKQAEERLKSANDSEESARLTLAKSESVTRQTYLVIDQPEMPRTPETSLRSMVQNFGIFVVVGLFLTALGIGASALLDRTLRFPIDVRHGLSLPVLALVAVAVPGQPLPARAVAPSPAASTSGDAAQGEASVLQPQL